MLISLYIHDPLIIYCIYCFNCSFPQCFTHCNDLGPCTAFIQIRSDCHICRDDVTSLTSPSDERLRQRLLIWTEAAGIISENCMFCYD